MVKFLHPTKNNQHSLNSITIKSNRQFWWICDKGHEWETSACQFSSAKNIPCPYCNNRKVLAGFNDLKTSHPQLAIEWSEKNDQKSNSVYAGSNKKVWWQCEKGHEWESQINSRAIQKTGCPYCKRTKVLTGFNDLETLKPLLAKEWHSIKNGELKVNSILPGSSLKVWWIGSCGHEWEAIISNRSRDKNPSGCPICKNQLFLSGYNDFHTIYPNKAHRWHDVKNKEKASEVFAHSESLYWWKCEKGHEYQFSALAQSKALNCQVCTNRIVQEGINDLGTVAPKIAGEWHPMKNGNLKATEVSSGQPKRAWWQCEKGHEWQASPNDRVSYNTRCPYCSNQRVLSGYNDLQTLKPELVKDWHPTKNIVKPSEVSVGGDLKVWWLCDKGHEWEAMLYTRTHPIKPTGCPSCSGTRLTPGLNDLDTMRPNLTLEWHPTKNHNLQSDMVTFKSSRKAWWLCDKGHEWEATVKNRSSGRGCQKCSSGKASSQAEKTILDFLQTRNIIVENNNRSILSGQELDMYLPAKKIAIEYNGLYWHTERAGKDREYHYKKWAKCKEQGIQLIQIWEDDWNRNPSIILNMILHKVGLSECPRMFARKLNPSELTTAEAQTFLEENHIQGWVSSTYYFGLKDSNDKIHAILSLKSEGKNNPKHYTLTRYATSSNVIGGFTKLLTFAEKTSQPKKVTTFSDHMVSDGGLYEKSGFTTDKELAPDYSYFDTKTRTRKHKFLYRLHRFRTDGNLTYVEGLTESQLAILNNISRIWDAGKTRWVKTY